MSDGSKYFSTTKKGEIYELKAELNSDKRERKKEAVKKVIASMTVGKDVSALFPDVINCMQTDNLELKKLVYLYLMNYAKSQPDLAILAVNSFVKDCMDPNPLIRALAVRTMGCIRVDKITEYLCEPLRKCLNDPDPYVRKTAAVCVAKLYDINGALVEDQGFLDMLKDLLSDSNHMVVANAVAALAEIAETSQQNVFEINKATLNKLLTALNECTEWGQIFILDALSEYQPGSEQEAQSIIERVSPRLQHANGAVVLSAVKVIMKYIGMVHDRMFIEYTSKKLAPPLVTLVSSEPEVQYVALRNINLVVQKMPNILNKDIKVFFVKYNDPIYVKLEKLNIILKLVDEENITQVLAELKEYATEVDVDFVRRSVRSIGRCAIKIESAAQQCIDTLLDLIQTRVNYVVQEAIVVIKDIFRRYPNRYESIIALLCENLESLDEPEAKAAMIWIIGEYSARIDNADELLESFLENFADENAQVQLQLLTSTVKLFLNKPQETQELVQRVLTLATQESDNPDLRDRGYIYWRLLSADPQAAQAVVLAEKPLISDEGDSLEPNLLDELIGHIGSLASVYHKPPHTFIGGRAGVRGRAAPMQRSMSQEGDEEERPEIYDRAAEARAAQGQEPRVISNQGGGNDLIGDLLDLNLDGGFSSGPAQPTGGVGGVGGGLDDFDMLGMGGAAGAGGYGGMGGVGQPQPLSVPMVNVLNPQQGKGLSIDASFERRSGQVLMNMNLFNNTMAPMNGFGIQFNKSSFGLVGAGPMEVGNLVPNASERIVLPMATTGPVQKMDPLNNLQVAVKNNTGVIYFQCQVPIHVFFTEQPALPEQQWLEMWGASPDSDMLTFQLSGGSSPDHVAAVLEANNIMITTKRDTGGETSLFCTVTFTNRIVALLEVKVSGMGINVIGKAKPRDVLPYIRESMSHMQF
eukprot:Clim_evm72s142 gene=Clim_evmTU72s142